MKKLFVLALALALLLGLAACGESAAPAEPASADAPAPAAQSDKAQAVAAAPEADAEGEYETWYGQAGGMDLSLALGTDGGYTLTIANGAQTGTWETRDGLICLDGEETGSILPVGGRLYWEAAGVWLSPDKSEFAAAYVPAEVITEGVSAELFNGYWTAWYAEADGAVLPAEDLGDETDLYIEAPRAALGGPLFGDVAVEMAYKDAALRFEAEGVSVTMQLQEDGLLRMSLLSPDGELTLYLVPTYVEGLSPEIEDAGAE